MDSGRTNSAMTASTSQENSRGNGGGSGGGGSGRPKSDEDRVKDKRERNKLAARRCRAKKSTIMQTLEEELATCKKDNMGLATHVTTLVSLYQREHRLKEEFKAMLRLLGKGDAKVFGGGQQSVNDLIATLEQGPADLTAVLRAMAGPEAAGEAAAAAAAVAASAGAEALGLQAPPLQGQAAK